MAKVELTVATWDYDRVRPIMDGRVKIEGCDINFIKVPPEECFHRAWNNQDFDVTEIGLSGYIIGTSRGDGRVGGTSPYVGIPVFLSRSFRVSGIYVRSDRGINSPADLKGKKVGVPEYQITAAVWSRGFLSDEYGVRVEDINWYQGGMSEPGRKDKWPNNLPEGFPLQHLKPGETINDLLDAGELDAFIGPRTPRSYTKNGTIRRLFENFEEVEKAYYRKTGIFPIMHPLGLRRELYEKHPWLALNIYLAFEEAKKISQAEFYETAALKIGHPWIVSSAMAAQEVLGPDIFPYGVESSRKTLEAAIRYSMEQHMAVRPVTIEELFPANTLEVPKT